MALEDYFDRMRQEVRQELERKRQQQEQEQEIDRKCKEALRPYAEQGLTWNDVLRKEHCPGTLKGMYEGLLQETEAVRMAKQAEQQEAEADLFLKGFASDPYSPVRR